MCCVFVARLVGLKPRWISLYNAQRKMGTLGVDLRSRPSPRLLVLLELLPETGMACGMACGMAY